MDGVTELMPAVGLVASLWAASGQSREHATNGPVRPIPSPTAGSATQ
jgi:hypothetical protein